MRRHGMMMQTVLISNSPSPRIKRGFTSPDLRTGLPGRSCNPVMVGLLCHFQKMSLRVSNLSCARSAEVGGAAGAV